MKDFARLVLILLGCAISSGHARGDAIDDLVKSEMERHQVAGLALVVVKAERPVKMAGYGAANLEWNTPVTVDTAFEIGSMTKQFTAACILLLAQDGKLTLDDPISRHLKNTPPAWVNITIRNLLTHTSGITNYTGLNGFELSKHLTQERFIAKVGAFPLTFPPGQAWSYCNTGYNLLGFIVENASGGSYWDFLRARILVPSQMTSTTSRTPALIVPRRAAGYELSNHIHLNRDYDLTDLFSAGAIVSTIPDLMKWDAALNGTNLLADSSLRQWWTPTRLSTGKAQNYGFGWFLDPLEGHRCMGHGGATSGFSATIQRFPDDHLSVIILTNADETGLATSIAKKIAQVYFAEAIGK